MTLLLKIGLINAAIVAVLAVLVLAITRVVQRPQLAHTLWILLLVKLVAPPIVSLPFEGWIPRETAARQGASPSAPSSASSDAAELSVPETPLARLAQGKEVENGTGQSVAESSMGRETAAAAPHLDWRWPLFLIWGSGSLAVAAIGVSRIRRFVRIVADTEAAGSEVQSDAAGLASSLGLRQVPDVRIVRGMIPPLVWGAGRRPVILLPAELLIRLDRVGRRTILAHELAHVRRRDHWVRWLESLVVVLYWWNPVVWFIRRELNCAEELCCDAWVVWLVPESQHAYAGALVETIDFLAGASTVLPAVASGIGRSFPMKTRITAILARPRAHCLPWHIQAAMLIVAMIALPLSAVPGVGIEPQAATRASQLQDVAFAMNDDQAGRDAAQSPAKGVATDEIDFNDVGEDELVGQVVDSGGKPMEGVEVDAWTWFPGHETRTNRQGRFRLKSSAFRGGIPEVQFSKPNYSPRRFVDARAGAPDWVVTLNDKTYFEGLVKGPDGKRVPNALVRAVRPRFRSAPPNWTESRAGADGRYRLYVEDDNYEIQVRAPGVGVATLNAAIKADEAKELNIALMHGVAFRARVIDSLSGQPVAGLRLRQLSPRAGMEGTSGKDGMLLIEDAFEGRFEFQVEAPGYARWWSEEAVTEWHRPFFEIENRHWQRNFDYLDFDLQPAGKPVTITVEQAVTIRGRVLDPDGLPVAGATVAPALTGTGNSLTGDTRFSVVTNNEGRYEMLLPASGVREYNLMAHDGKYEEWRYWANGVAKPFETKPGETIADFDIRLTRPATVRGRVVNAAGQPVARRQVRASAFDELENRYYDPTTLTDKDGKFELKFVRPGQHFIQVAPFWLRAAEAPSATTYSAVLVAGQIDNDVELEAQPERQ